MNNKTEKQFDNFSAICVERCGGLCCDPWWGIIHYTFQTAARPDNSALLDELVQSIKKREKRIREAYVTKENPPRPLFGAPESYSLILRNITPEGNALRLDLIALFAFRCRFLSDEKTCLIHPTANPDGRDIRPPHCARLGTPGAKPGQEGYCRIIGAAVNSDQTTCQAAVDEAIKLEKQTASEYIAQGLPDPSAAANKVVEKIKAYLLENPTQNHTPATGKKTGRNEPCPCGSGKKFKKCHGK
jgi:Fe-S-cluster containining protein